MIVRLRPLLAVPPARLLVLGFLEHEDIAGAFAAECHGILPQRPCARPLVSQVAVDALRLELLFGLAGCYRQPSGCPALGNGFDDDAVVFDSQA